MAPEAAAEMKKAQSEAQDEALQQFETAREALKRLEECQKFTREIND